MNIRNLFKRIFIAAALLAVPATASAEDEAERRFKAQNKLKKDAARVDKKCGTQIAVQLDYDKFDAKLRKKYAISSWCENVLSALRNLCRGPKTMAHIQKRVQTYRCTPATDGRKITIKDGTVTMFLDFEGKNYGDFAKKELVRKL